ncbi:MAG: hypothetical protein GC154_15045 [bacterium]|nr:hypothetical protein [bacterium]
MAMQYHEPPEWLTKETREMHRALRSLIEELEAIDWYQHRVDATEDEDLRAILAHNRDEEAEHAAMTLEWIRRRYPKMDEELRAYLFTEGPIHLAEEKKMDGEEGGGSPASGGGSSLNLGPNR